MTWRSVLRVVAGDRRLPVASPPVPAAAPVFDDDMFRPGGNRNNDFDSGGSSDEEATVHGADQPEDPCWQGRLAAAFIDETTEGLAQFGAAAHKAADKDRYHAMDTPADDVEPEMGPNGAKRPAGPAVGPCGEEHVGASTTGGAKRVAVAADSASAGGAGAEVPSSSSSPDAPSAPLSAAEGAAAATLAAQGDVSLSSRPSVRGRQQFKNSAAVLAEYQSLRKAGAGGGPVELAKRQHQQLTRIGASSDEALAKSALVPGTCFENLKTCEWCFLDEQQAMGLPYHMVFGSGGGYTKNAKKKDDGKHVDDATDGEAADKTSAQQVCKMNVFCNNASYLKWLESGAGGTAEAPDAAPVDAEDDMGAADGEDAGDETGVEGGGGKPDSVAARRMRDWVSHIKAGKCCPHVRPLRRPQPVLLPAYSNAPDGVLCVSSPARLLACCRPSRSRRPTAGGGNPIFTKLCARRGPSRQKRRRTPPTRTSRSWSLSTCRTVRSVSTWPPGRARRPPRRGEVQRRDPRPPMKTRGRVRMMLPRSQFRAWPPRRRRRLRRGSTACYS